ncbi:Subtilase family protein [Sinosporangium album]|uniref:Subtilase family protein n=1 Tax=Sinosporangium album TaxID=504805 RepID=A0A1G7V5C2_9ACTN|nr:S8 family serine peptidase [Sinosporangium album]SDG54927.1 Subtilase family protein [Sinosporangium album]
MKRVIVAATVATLAATTLAAPAQARPSSAQTAAESEYVVLYKEGAGPADARQAVQAAGGTVVKENTAVGLATVTSSNSEFSAHLQRNPAVEGVARNRVIGAAPKNARAMGETRKVVEERAIEQEGSEPGPSAARPAKPKPKAEPLSELQWDMKQIRATADGSHKYEQGDRRVLVGVIDTGIDGSHPDIAPNFNRELSRNFTVDIPYDANNAVVDGPCETDPDQSCNDPNDVDEAGHGTHVASSIASPINNLGVAGVAPKVTLVNLRAGQDSGFFFLQPSVDAITYAADIGVDVANMSYYIDPWLFNCADNPADSEADRLEQRTITSAVQRALDYAHKRGVTLVAAAGNQALDYTKENIDESSPDFASEPGEAPYRRVVPASCLSLPTEGNHVIAVASTGISKRKSYFSSYGNGFTDIAAPGGDVYDTPTNQRDVTKSTLSAYPKSVAEAAGELNPDGTPNVTSLVRDCSGTVCGYYRFSQGTSMASPRAAGVAALIVSKYGERDRRRGGLTMDPEDVQEILVETATATRCPSPAAFTYTRNLPNGTTVTETHTCEGGRGANGFYGPGIVDALRAVR